MESARGVRVRQARAGAARPQRPDSERRRLAVTVEFCASLNGAVATGPVPAFFLSQGMGCSENCERRSLYLPFTSTFQLINLNLSLAGWSVQFQSQVDQFYLSQWHTEIILLQYKTSWGHPVSEGDIIAPLRRRSFQGNLFWMWLTRKPANLLRSTLDSLCCSTWFK